FDDLETGRLDEEEWPTRPVLPRGSDGYLLDKPLKDMDRSPRATDVVKEKQLPARLEHAPHLSDRGGRVRDRAEREGAHHGVERLVVERQLLGIAFVQVDAAAQTGRPLTGDG